MKKLLTFVLFLSIVFQGFAKEIVISGYYQGENLLIINPFDTYGQSFCIEEISVNGQKSGDEINSSAFELNLAVYQLRKGDTLCVIIKHKEECSPKVLNEEILRPISSFVITSIVIDKEGLLKWSTIEENGKLPFYVEQFRWGRWIKIGEFPGSGTPKPHEYALHLYEETEYIRPHAEKNRYRVKQIDYRGKSRFSLETNYAPVGQQKVSIDKDKSTKKIFAFTAFTSFEVISETGDVIKTGYSDKADLSTLKKGKYFLNYDASTQKIKLK